MSKEIIHSPDDFDHKLRLETPRGKDVSQQGSTLTVASTATAVNTITNTADKIVRVTGFNYIDRTNISTISLVIDRGGDTERTISFNRPPHAPTEFGRVRTFDPPLVALTKVEVMVTDDGTPIAAMESLINAFETDN